MKEFSDEFGGFFQTEIMGDTHLWLGDHKISQELFGKRANIYSSRPEVPAVPGSDTQGQYLPLIEYAGKSPTLSGSCNSSTDFVDSDPWRRQRKFAHMVLAQSHNARYYGYATHEVKRMMAKLLVEPKDYYAHGDHYCSRITARLAYGKPDAAVAISDNAHLFVPQISPAGPITNLMPFLGKLPEWLNPSIRDSRLRREKEKVLWVNELHKVKEELDKGQCSVPSYARRYWESKEKGKEPFDENEAAYAVGMLSTVAIITITGPLNVFFLAMVLHPEWQEKARKEIDAVVGDRLVEVTDSPYLPTLRAVIQECVRWRPPVPLGMLHPI
jgi:cytochrome P450